MLPAITDPNLRLAIINELMLNQPDLFPQAEVLIPQVLGRAFDVESEGYDRLPAMDAYFQKFDLSDDLLRTVTRIIFDGGNDIYHYIWWWWGGEADAFTVRDLTGIERCTALREFVICSMADTLDLSPLRSIRSLERVSLDAVPHRGLDALLQLPALNQLELYATDYYQSNSAIRALQARGVAIKWFS